MEDPIIFHLHLCKDENHEDNDEYLILNKDIQPENLEQESNEPLFIDKMASNDNLLALMDFEYEEDDTWKIYHTIYSQEHKLEKKTKNIMKQYETININREWLRQTKYACWWCCHKFQTPPCFIPIDYKNDIFYVFGNFCSFNCALSYNFEKQFNNWTNYSELIELLYRKIYKKRANISYAPDKTALDTFGGELTITEYRRNFFMNNTSYDVIYPPIQSIIPYLEQTVRTPIKENLNVDKDLMARPLQKHLISTVKKKSKQQMKLSESMFA